MICAITTPISAQRLMDRMGGKKIATHVVAIRVFPLREWLSIEAQLDALFGDDAA